jgi:two-component system response regulator FlrC
MSTEVLLVDDDAAVRRAVGGALTYAGFKVTAVENGLAALAALQDHAFAVVVSDIRMQYLDGIRFYRELEAEYPELRQRVVFVTAWPRDPEVDALVEQSGRPLLRKPFELRDLLDVVKDTASQGPASRDAYAPFASAEAHRLRAMVLESGTSLVCPRCGGALMLRSAREDGQAAGWDLLCHNCRRKLTVQPWGNGPFADGQR